MAEPVRVLLTGAGAFYGGVLARGRINLPALGALLVVLGFWIGGKVHPLGFILAAIPIGIWAWLSVAQAMRKRRAKRAPQEPRA